MADSNVFYLRLEEHDREHVEAVALRNESTLAGAVRWIIREHKRLEDERLVDTPATYAMQAAAK